MEPIVLVGAVIVIFGLWQEVKPVMQQVCKVIATSRTMAKLTSLCTEQSPAYPANTWLERKAG